MGCHLVAVVHIYTQTIHRTIQNNQYIHRTIQNNQYIEHNNWKSAGRAPSWLVIPWHLPYNRGKKHGKTSVRVAASKNTWTTISIHRQR
jgi:hypothetical protein